MNREELLNAAHEAGFVVNFKESRIGIQNGFFVKDCTSEVERFAAMVAADARAAHIAAQTENEALKAKLAASGVAERQQLPQTKLLDLDVIAIRSAARQRESLRAHITNNLSNAALAKQFGVHIRTIEKVLHRETHSNTV